MAILTLKQIVSKRILYQLVLDTVHLVGSNNVIEGGHKLVEDALEELDKLDTKSPLADIPEDQRYLAGYQI